MTKIITIATRKGGSGKTTIATNLAVESANRKLTSLIIDCDFETEIAFNWFGARDNLKTNDYLFCVEAYKANSLKEIIKTAKENKVDYIYIDTPGTGDNLVNEAVVQSDYCLIPCGAGGFDMVPIQKTVHLVQTLRKNASFIITKSQSNSNETKDTDGFLRSFGINICNVKLTNLKIYRDAAVLGKSVVECDPLSKASREIKELFNWMQKRLKKNPLQEKLAGVSHA